MLNLPLRSILFFFVGLEMFLPRLQRSHNSTFPETSYASIGEHCAPFDAVGDTTVETEKPTPSIFFSFGHVLIEGCEQT